MAIPRQSGDGVNPTDGGGVSAASATTTVQASSQTPITLPSGQFASDAEYLQQGDDLVLIGTDGTTIVVRDYFLSDPPPDLLTPEGGRLTPEIVDSFTPPEAVGQYAQAGDSAAAPIGQATSTIGQVFVVRTNGVRETIGAGDAIYQGDVIETADGGAVDILFVDKTTFALGGDARLAIDKLVYNPETHEGSSSYSILKGMFVFSSGEIAKVNPLDMTVKTTVATIGIRGTKVAGDVKPSGEDSKFTILEGEIIVTTDAGYVVLSEANETTFVAGFNMPPTEAVVLDKNEINSFYGDVKGISKDFYGASSSGGQGSEGEGGEANLEELAEALSDLAPAAGSAGEGEGEGEGDAPVISPLPSPIDPERGFTPTENGPGQIGAGSGTSGGFGGDDNGLNDLLGGGDGGPTNGLGRLFDRSGETASVTVSGTEGDDTIIGGAGNDLLAGHGGNDSITGGDGDDHITGGDGDDVVFGGNGDDVIVAGTGGGDDSYDGGAGNDTIIFSSSSVPVTINLETGFADGLETEFDSIANIENVVGGSGDDTITGNASDNSIFGGDGNDGLSGGDGSDTLDGGNGDDGIAGGAGTDLIDGGDGDDFATGGIGDDTIFGGAGEDGLFGDDGDDVIDGGDDADGINGGEGDDTLRGGGGNDNIVGAAGQDTLDGDAGRDTLDGGEGDDLLRGGSDDDVYRISLGFGADRIEDSSGDNDRIALSGLNRDLSELNGTSRVGDDLIIRLAGDDITIADHFGDGTVESITFEFDDGTNRTFTLANGTIGDGAGSVIVGTSAHEVLNGSDGNDVIIGNGGNDRLVGRGGDDVFVVSGADDGFDRIFGGSGFDRIEGSAGDDVIGLSRHAGEESVEEIVGGPGEDVIRGTSGPNRLDFSETTLSGIARIEGGAGHDVIIGSSEADTIVGGAGNDLLQGGEGNDLFLVYGSNDGFDRIFGGSGFDRIEGSAGDDVIGLSRHAGEESVEEIVGGPGEDVIRGTSGPNRLDFSETVLSGIARIEGSAGNDIVIGSSGSDTILGGSGNDLIFGGLGDDVLVGGSDSDRLLGEDGNDRFIIENDAFLQIEGGAGFDTVQIDFALDLGNVANNTLRGIESFDLGDGLNISLTIGLDDVLAATNGVNALTGNENSLVIRRDGDAEVNVVGADWVESAETLDADGDDVAEGYTVFTDNASGAAVYVENVV